MNPQDKITFDLVSIYSGTSPRTIELLITDKKGKTTWVDSYGNIFHRELERGESPAQFSIGATETYVDPKSKEKALRVFKTFSYYPEEFEGQLSSDEKADNMVNRHAHTWFKLHPAVVVKDATGGNINPNQTGALLLFEMRETTKNINDEVAKNMLISECTGIVTDMYQNSPETFLDLCYRYGIQSVKTMPIEKLYNLVILKINNNASHFMEILNHKDAEMLVMIKKAMIGTEEEPAIISYQEPFYIMNGENLGRTDEEIIDSLYKSPRSRAYLATALGMPTEDVVEVVKLPKESDAITETKGQIDYGRRVDAARIDEAKKFLNGIVSRWKTEKAKDRSKAAEIEAKHLQRISEKREEYIDIADFYDKEAASRINICREA
jgi:hypothetical protein